MAQNVNPTTSRLHEAAEKDSNSRWAGISQALHSGAIKLSESGNGRYDMTNGLMALIVAFNLRS